ncbi:MAG: CoA transferase, partial [Pseudomonadota bacterium]
EISLPAMPISIDGARPGLSINPPEIGEHSEQVLQALGLSEDEIEQLIEQGLIDSFRARQAPQPAE